MGNRRLPVCISFGLVFLLLAGFSGADWKEFINPAGGGSSASLGKQPKRAEEAASGRMPLLFVPNQGQTDSRARFIMRAGGQTIYLTDTGVVFDSFYKERSGLRSRDREQIPIRGKRLTWRLDFERANSHPLIEGISPASAKFHYLIGNDPAKWITDVASYQGVVYHDLYPGVDLKFYGNKGRLEYDLAVQPGADPKDVSLACKGVEKLAVKDGELVASTALGEIRQSRPYIYQEREGEKVEVEGGFRLLGKDRFGFAINAFDRTLPLVIDPQLLTLPYSTYLGGGGLEEGNDIDEYNDDLYVVGDTGSALFPVTVGAYDTTHNGSEVFVAKIDPSLSGASSLAWCTFLGGTGSEEGNGIDAGYGSPIVCGTTYSGDFPQVNNGYLEPMGDSDGFVARLNSSGNALVYSAVFGTGGYDFCNDLSVSGEHVWVCGNIPYGDALYPSSSSRHSYGYSAYPNYGDAFVLQFDTDPFPVGIGTIILLGGSYSDTARGVAINDMEVYVVGDTYSDDFVTTPGAYDTVFSGGESYNRDVFVCKFDWGGGMTFSTFVGNSEEADTGCAISLGSGGAYICGHTYGEFPIVNGYDDSRNHSYQSSGFVARVRSDGTALDYSTYIETDHFGGIGEAMAIRTGGSSRTDCWVAGDAWIDLHGIYDKNYYQTYQGQYDAFVIRLDTAETGLDSLIFATHLGGADDEFGQGVVGYLNNAFVTGYTESSDFPTANAFDNTHNGERDVFVSHVREPLPAVTTNAASLVYSASASLNGQLTAMSGAPRIRGGFDWGTTSGGPYPNRIYSDTATSVPYDFTESLTSLTPGVTYYYQAFAYNALYDFVYGAERSFTTQAAAAPTVTTAAISNITGTTADSGGNVTSGGSDPVTERGVCWNTSGTPTTANAHTSDGGGSGAFTSNMTGLSSNTTYYVRAYATNAVGTSYGQERSFTTDTLPTVTTAAVTNIGGSTADSGGNVTSDGGEAVTARGVCWNLTGSPTTANVHTADGSGTGEFTSSLTGLSASTTYYVRAYATSSVGTSYGNEESFTTDSLPTVTTTAASNITGSTAQSGGNITSNGNSIVYAAGVCWNTTGTPTVSDSHTDDGGGTGPYTSSLTGLTPNTTYYVRAYATNEVGTSYGGQETFTTDTVPTVTTTAISNITGSSADSGGEVTSDGGEAVTARGICWDTSTGPTTDDSTTSDGTGTGVFTSSLTGLTPGTTYYVRAYATNSVGTAYGSERSFTTDTQPTVTTTAVSNVTSNSADSGGEVTSDGGEAVTARGVCWNTTGAPTTSDSTTSDGTGTGVFASSLTGLTPGQTYYVRAYATNSVGTAYGGEVSFTTLPEVPVAQPASAVWADSFQANWSAAAGATGYYLDVGLDAAFSSFVAGYNNLNVGNVTSYSVSGLTPATPYYYRLRAANAGGTSANSNVISLTTLALHTVTFSAGPGGSLTGTLNQAVVNGSNCTPVTAVPNTGYRFIDWTGTGGFWSAANPLVVNDVQADLVITAQFANLAPVVRIISPADGAIVWGSVNVLAEAIDDSLVERVDFFVDGIPVQAAGLAGLSRAATPEVYSFVWNSLAYASGPHVIRAVARDASGATGMDQITVNLQNVSLTITAQRLEDRAWIVRKEFVRLQLAAVNSGNAPVARYVIFRRCGGSAEEVIATVDSSELLDGAYEYNDLTLPTSGSCTYRVQAETSDGMVVGRSNEVTL